jgi:hypothetical protein
VRAEGPSVDRDLEPDLLLDDGRAAAAAVRHEKESAMRRGSEGCV